MARRTARLPSTLWIRRRQRRPRSQTGRKSRTPGSPSRRPTRRQKAGLHLHHETGPHTRSHGPTNAERARPEGQGRPRRGTRGSDYTYRLTGALKTKRRSDERVTKGADDAGRRKPRIAGTARLDLVDPVTSSDMSPNEMPKSKSEGRPKSTRPILAPTRGTPTAGPADRSTHEDADAFHRPSSLRHPTTPGAPLQQQARPTNTPHARPQLSHAQEDHAQEARRSEDARRTYRPTTPPSSYTCLPTPEAIRRSRAATEGQSPATAPRTAQPRTQKPPSHASPN